MSYPSYATLAEALSDVVGANGHTFNKVEQVDLVQGSTPTISYARYESTTDSSVWLVRITKPLNGSWIVDQIASQDAGNLSELEWVMALMVDVTSLWNEA